MSFASTKENSTHRRKGSEHRKCISRPTSADIITLFADIIAFLTDVIKSITYVGLPLSSPIALPVCKRVHEQFSGAGLPPSCLPVLWLPGSRWSHLLQHGTVRQHGTAKQHGTIEQHGTIRHDPLGRQALMTNIFDLSCINCQWSSHMYLN